MSEYPSSSVQRTVPRSMRSATKPASCAWYAMWSPRLQIKRFSGRLSSFRQLMWWTTSSVPIRRPATASATAMCSAIRLPARPSWPEFGIWMYPLRSFQRKSEADTPFGRAARRGGSPQRRRHFVMVSLHTPMDRAIEACDSPEARRRSYSACVIDRGSGLGPRNPIAESISDGSDVSQSVQRYWRSGSSRAAVWLRVHGDGGE